MAIHFTKEEFTERKSKIIQELKKQGLDALLIFRQESMYWLTGYDTMGFVFFQCLILTTKGDVVLLTRAPDLRQAQNTSIIDDIRIWIDKDKSNPTNELKNILLELGLEKSNLGVEYEAYGLTGRNAINLNNSLKNYATLHDKSELISYFRAVKSPAEIVYVKKAAELADKALDEVWKIAKSGVRALVQYHPGRTAEKSETLELLPKAAVVSVVTKSSGSALFSHPCSSR